MQRHLNPFTLVAVEGIRLARMRLGHVAWGPDVEEAPRTGTRIVLTVDPRKDARHSALFEHVAEEHFEMGGAWYRRDDRRIVASEQPELWYQGRVPGVWLHIRVEVLSEKVRIAVNASRGYVALSRTRCSYLPPLEDTLDRLLLLCSVASGLLPLHCAAVELPQRGKEAARGGTGGEGSTVLLVGLMNAGKTTTAVELARRVGGKLVTEEVAFVDVRDGTVYSSPRTSRELAPGVSCGGRAALIAYLDRRMGREGVRAMEDRAEVAALLYDLNAYTFSWSDMFVNNLFDGSKGAPYARSYLDAAYRDLVDSLAASIPALHLRGTDPTWWAEALRQEVASWA